jgi:hypothetical protein
MDEISSVSFSALCERYSRLAELYGWRGNVYLLSIELWRLLKTLSNLPVDPGFYEERVKEMMSKGGRRKTHS